jgi:chromatin remodeling complex protein RSC6
MTTKQKSPSAFMKPVKPSKELGAVVGTESVPRTEITKKLWAYIKKNELQNPKNKREIVPDEKLAKVFGTKEGVDMFQMTRLVGKHLS